MDKKTANTIFDCVLVILAGFVTYALAASVFKTESMVARQGSLLSQVSQRVNALAFIASAPVKEAEAEAETSTDADVPDM